MIRPICLTERLTADTIVAVPEQSVPQQESYSPIDPRDWPARFREMSEFVGLSDEDLDLIRASGPLVQAKLQGFVDHIYDHFLEYPEARKFFVLDNGSPDRKRIDDNKLTMIRWMMNNCLAHINDGFSRYVAAIGTMHYSVRCASSPLASRALQVPHRRHIHVPDQAGSPSSTQKWTTRSWRPGQVLPGISC